MAAAHNVTNPGTKRVTSLKTEGVKALKFSSDANRNRVAFDLWNATFRAAIGDHYSRLLDERPPTFITFAADYPGHSEESVAASYVHAQEVWREDSQLVCNAITRTCNFEDDPSGQLLDDLLSYETAAERYSYLQSEFLDVSSAKKQDELVGKWESLPILSGPRPYMRAAVEYKEGLE